MSVVLRTNHITKKYYGRPVVEDLSLTIHRGDIYAFIGKNGAGKTTLLKMVSGLCTPSEGNMLLFGGQDLIAARARIGTVIESPALLPNLSARENLVAECKLRGEDPAVIAGILEQVGLADTGRKKARDFSLGMRQRLAIAIALVGQPDFLVLDEPTNGLDPQGMREVRELLLDLNHRAHITILISSHILSELSRLATRYGIIHQGRLLEEFTEDQLWERCKVSGNTALEMDLEDYFIQAIGGK